MEELEKQLLDVLNESKIPFEAKVYVLKHVHSIAEAQFKQLLTESANDDGGANRTD